MNHYDVLIIGAGHNGLTAAAYLSKAGKRVLVLEKRPVIGGFCVGENDTPALAPFPRGILRPDIIRHLSLERFGLNPAPVSTDLISLLPGGRQLVLSADTAKTVDSISQFSKTDAARWPAFVRFIERAAAFLEAAYATPIPRLPKFSLAEGIPLAQLALKLRALGPKDMHNVIRLLPMTVKELLDEWFESEELKAAIATLGIHNANLGVMSAGSAYNLLHQYLIRGGSSPERNGRGWGQPVQHTHQVIAALEQAARAYGAEIRLNAEVARIMVENDRVTGVRLHSGEHLAASTVLSSVDPKTTFLRLVTPEPLDPEFVWQAQRIKMRGVTAKLQLTLASSVHPLEAIRASASSSVFIIAPSLTYLERAYDAAKYGQISEKPYLEMTPTGNLLSIHFQFAPYFLKPSAWNEETRRILAQTTWNTLNEYAPHLQSEITNLKSLTPLDLETTFALTEGDPHHGQILLDQFFFMRPLPGYADYKTPIEGLYLCGSGTHGGGGVSGIPGRNAAKSVLA
ncbi:MAG: NAD(P)/FAD-dependent oxidoreductase [Anaerolineales bacterium]|nr:NAD(P)/FAD-dependent oxidoreductase [Anaerolineales bacterium]MCX7755367.1 NAD(P)/FAD-dependent oxidoreductase [Anaerolineales bacterium]MDW8279106.1 NAD(P)/FAD-dependent oxidoreductase [Anaerolineales bacterium]